MSQTSIVDTTTNQIGAGISNLKTKLHDFNSKVSGLFSPGGLFLFLFVLSVLCYMFITNETMKSKLLNNIDNITIYKMKSLKHINSDYLELPLRNFYIKTALNACCIGDWVNGYVDMSALEQAILRGYRCLDFEIYSFDNIPVVAVSSNENIFTQIQTYNNVPFELVCKKINEIAFTKAPNKEDPLLLSIRIKTNNQDVVFVKQLIDCLKIFSGNLLGPEYNYEYGDQNLGKVPIKNFMGKIIVLSDISSPVVKNGCPTTCFRQYVNIGIKSPFLHKLDYILDIKNAPSMTDLIEHNKKNMSMVFTSYPYSVNINVNACVQFGCQLIGVIHTLKDDEYIAFDEFFKDSAFVLKPAKLCYQPLVINKPPPQNPELSFSRRDYKTEYASWSG